MKTVKLSLLSLTLLLSLASCKKDDFRETDAPATEAPLTEGVDGELVGWKSVDQWERADQETFSVQYVAIDDASITSEVADDGLVLVFKRNGNTINSLPFEESSIGAEDASNEDAETATEANYWYHQVTEGSLLISCDVYNATTPDAATSFKYFVVTPEKLKELETAGHTTENLMNLNYADAAALLGTL